VPGLKVDHGGKSLAESQISAQAVECDEDKRR